MSLWSNDAIWSRVFRACAVGSAAILLLIVAFLVLESAAGWTAVGIRFITDDAWHPAADVASGDFNLIPALIGSLGVTTLAILLAAPAAILVAVYRVFVAEPRPGQSPLRPWSVQFLRSALRRVLEVAAGVPSVVFGLWGLTTLVPLIARWQQPGTSLLAGGIILALMILPTLALMADSVLSAFPREQVIAAQGLGLSTPRLVFSIVLPCTWRGLLAAVMLSVVRALGETMAVVMVAGNVVQIPRSLLAPARTLTASIALEMGYALGVHRSALFCCGCVLLTAVVLIVLVADALGGRHVRTS